MPELDRDMKVFLGDAGSAAPEPATLGLLASRPVRLGFGRRRKA